MAFGTMARRNGGLLRKFDVGSDITTGPGDPAYSPTDAVSQSPRQYGLRPIDPTMEADVFTAPGKWEGPVNVNPSQYINQNVGGVANDVPALGWSKGLQPFTQYRQPFTGAVLTPPRPNVLVVGSVGRLGQRDTLAARVKASTTDYAPSPQQVANAMVNPQVGF